MPRITNRAPGGCIVSGTYLAPDGAPSTGQIEFVPDHGGIDVNTGLAYSGESVSTTPDPITGQWQIGLAPSSIVGAYVVNLGTLKLRAIVPDEPESKFEQIVEVKNGK